MYFVFILSKQKLLLLLTEKINMLCIYITMTYLKNKLCSFISFTIIILNKDITYFVLTYE